MTYAIRKVKKNGVKGYQVVKFNLDTYFVKNGYSADEIEVEGAFFKRLEDAEEEAMNLQMEDE